MSLTFDDDAVVFHDSRITQNRCTLECGKMPLPSTITTTTGPSFITLRVDSTTQFSRYRRSPQLTF